MTPERIEEFRRTLREIAEDPQCFIPDQEAYELLHKLVVWGATEIGVFSRQGELLLHHRHFREWPGEWGKIKSWYIPGGYMKPADTLESSCRFHLEKDGVTSPIRFATTCGVIKWQPGEHPFSNLLSVACVCLMTEDELRCRPGTEADFKFSSTVVPSLVPYHTELQEMFFRWRDEHHDLWVSRP